MKVTFHADALAEYVDAVVRYERDYPGRGARFVVAIEKVLAAIAGQPDAFPARLGVRAALADRFPYVVFFKRLEGETIHVLAVAHAKRLPNYWRERR